MKVLAVLFLFVALACANQALRCGQVFDGLNSDVDEFSGLKFKASWADFEDGKERNRIVRYEWAIISSDQITEDSVAARECRLTAGFRGLPVYGWQNVGTATVAVGTPSLQAGKTYYTIVRATTALGQQRYINSDGFTFTDAKLNTRSTENTKKVTRDESTGGDSSECSIDQAWACTAAKVSIRERLDAIYGPASGQFLPFNLASATAFVVIPLGELGTEDDPESNNGGGNDSASLNVGTIIGIGIGITAFFCLLTIGAIIIASFTGKGGLGGDNVRPHQNIEEF